MDPSLAMRWPRSVAGRPGEDSDRADGRRRERPTVVVGLASHLAQRGAEPLLLLPVVGDPQLTADEGGESIERIEGPRRTLDPHDLGLAPAGAKQLGELGQ